MCIRDSKTVICVLIKLNSAISVSYTHLDVYKRQVKDVFIFKKCSIDVIFDNKKQEKTNEENNSK